MNRLWSYVYFKVLHSNKDVQITVKHTITRTDVTNIMQKRSPTVWFPLLKIHKEGNSAMVMEVDGGYSWAKGVMSGCSTRRLLSF